MKPHTRKATKDQTEALQLIEAGFEMLKIAPDGTIYSGSANNEKKMLGYFKKYSGAYVPYWRFRRRWLPFCLWASSF
jgi:hypothetical protein